MFLVSVVLVLEVVIGHTVDSSEDEIIVGNRARMKNKERQPDVDTKTATLGIDPSSGYEVLD